MNYFLIPIYNEEENIGNLAADLLKVVQGTENHFVFSDDGSKDRSTQEIEKHFSGHTLTILGDGINRGPGMAFNRGFEWILEHSKNAQDVVITIEADCTSDSRLIPKMIAVHQLGYDLVLASVYAQGGGFDGTTFFRKLISSVANLLFRFVFDVKVLTLSSFYRLYDINLLRKIKVTHGSLINESGFICMLEILVKAISQHAVIVELPMTLHSKKRLGKSKMKIFKTSMEYLRFMIKWKLHKK